MTGYGKSVAVYNGKKINVEIKSLNSKALDLSTRIAPLYREKEMEIRQNIQQHLLRGKLVSAKNGVYKVKASLGTFNINMRKATVTKL